jgi:hypothetical protein
MTLRDPSPALNQQPVTKAPYRLSARRLNVMAALLGAATPWCMQQYPATALACKPFVGSASPGPRTASTNSSEARPTALGRTCPRRRASRNARCTHASHRQPQRRFADAAVQRGSSGSFS